MDDFTLTVDVTADDIKHGSDEYSSENPVERAIGRGLDDRGMKGFEVEIDYSLHMAAVIHSDDFSRWLDIAPEDDEALSDWLWEWACGREMTPATFMIAFTDHDPTP